MRRFAVVLLGACTFAHGERSKDAAPDVITVCTPGEHVCSGRQLETCDASGGGIDPALTITCPLTCEVNECTRARNIPDDLQRSCTKATGTAFVLGAGDATTYAGYAYAGLDETINCYAGYQCAGAPLAPTGKVDQPGDRDLVWYCLSEFTMASANSFMILNDDSLFSPVFFVDGDVILEGTIDNDGDDAGQAGPGGYRGGGLSAATGQSGLGGCAGGGGVSLAGVGGGGGGGGLRTVGGRGGDGGAAGGMADGGPAGGASCDSMFLEPLVGGSGGGGGATGTCTGGCGQPGGGGGGALQIVATGRIEIRASARLLDNGGRGGADVSGGYGGGGGGGAGGAILLEAPQIVVDGQLIVDGGGGGASTTAGGAGGTNAALPTAGAMFTTSPQGGGGGGGATGRIRIESESAAACPAATTTADPCTSGPLARVAPVTPHL